MERTAASRPPRAGGVGPCVARPGACPGGAACASRRWAGWPPRALAPQRARQPPGEPLERELAVARLAAGVLRDRADDRAAGVGHAPLLGVAERRRGGDVEDRLDREAVMLACWPPGPEERLVRSWTSSSGIARRSLIWSVGPAIAPLRLGPDLPLTSSRSHRRVCRQRGRSIEMSAAEIDEARVEAFMGKVVTASSLALAVASLTSNFELL